MGNQNELKKIAIFCLHYGWLTGSELYFFELIRLLKDNYTITLYSNIDNRLEKYTKFGNVRYFNIRESNPDNYDLLIVSHGNFIINNINNNVLNKNTPIINICHSELLPQETPLLIPQVKYYIGIRQSILNILNRSIDNTKLKLIYNPIDENRFNMDNVIDEKYGLFIGTMNHLRINPFKHFYNYCKNNNLTIKYIGDIDINVKNTYKDVEYISPIINVENYIKKSTICGGIINGRTYWEALLCGKQTIEYIVDQVGNITNILYDERNDIELVKSKYVKNQLIELIESI